MHNGHKPSDEALIDLQRFPVLVEEADRVAAPSGASASGGSLGALVTNTLRDVLGWRVKANDSRGFTAALTQAFTGKEVDGRVEWRWNERTYAVQADLGAITGAQASIYSRAKNALDQSLPLLDGLYSLDADADAEDQDAIRDLIRAELTDLVNELGTTGGPRVQRVDKLFALLVNDDPDASLNRRHSLETVGGHLRILGERFNITQDRVNTIAEEQNQTNYLILVEHVLSLLRSWRDNRKFFRHTGDQSFIGTQFVLLSRDLAVLAESVQAAYAAMDSVYLGAAERETTLLRLHIVDRCLDYPCQEQDEYSGPIEVISIAELLRWVQSFASEEGPRILRDGGKDGVELAFRPTLRRLQQLVRAAGCLANCASSNPTPAYHSARVRLALHEIEQGIASTLRNTKGIRRAPNPTIHWVVPVSGPDRPDHVLLIAPGQHYQPTAKVVVDNAADGVLPVELENAQITETQVQVFVPRSCLDDLLGTETTATLTFTVEHIDGGVASEEFDWSRSAPTPPPTAPTGPTAAPPPPRPPRGPTFESIDPASSYAGEGRIEFTLTGTGFIEPAHVIIGDGVEVTNERVEADGTRITGILEVRQGADEGEIPVQLVNGDDKKKIHTAKNLVFTVTEGDG